MERRALLSTEIEQLVVEAKRLGLAEDEVVKAIQDRWTKLFGDDEKSRIR
jgi:DNA-binding transcriptional regulator YhcF (GntR family)